MAPAAWPCGDRWPAALSAYFSDCRGLLLGPLLGAALGEWRARRCWLQAGKVGVATFVGLIIGTVAKVGTALAMLGVLVFALLL